MTPKQRKHLDKLIKEHADTHAVLYREYDQDFVGSVVRAEISEKEAKAKLTKYLDKLTNKA